MVLISFYSKSNLLLPLGGHGLELVDLLVRRVAERAHIGRRLRRHRREERPLQLGVVQLGDDPRGLKIYRVT